MGRVNKAFCCCFRSSSYEIASESEDNNYVISKSSNKTKSEQEEKLLQLQDLQVITIKPKLQTKNSDIRKQNQNSMEFIKVHNSSEVLTYYLNNNNENTLKENYNITNQNNHFENFPQFNNAVNSDDDGCGDQFLQINLKLKKYFFLKEILNDSYKCIHINICFNLKILVKLNNHWLLPFLIGLQMKF